MYEERTYRRVSRPRDLVCYEVVRKETDLFCCTSVDLKAFIEGRALFYRNQLETYIRERPEFLESLRPVAPDPLAPKMVKEMVEASAALGVGPMACVAGAVAEFIGRDIDPRSDEYIIENGGDIFLRTRRERKVLVYAKDSPYSERIGLKLKPSDESIRHMHVVRDRRSFSQFWSCRRGLRHRAVVALCGRTCNKAWKYRT